MFECESSCSTYNILYQYTSMVDEFKTKKLDTKIKRKLEYIKMCQMQIDVRFQDKISRTFQVWHELY